MRNRISMLALLSGLVLAIACAGPRPADAQSARTHGTTTIVLVRHAEKAAAPEDDPRLTAAGAARAQALLDALGDADVQAVYSTQFARTRATAEPLAEAAGVPVTIVPAGGGAPDYITTVAERARTEHPGDVVVIVGHSNTLGRTIAALGGPSDIGDLPDDRYDAFYIVLLAEGREPRVIEARYGEPGGR